MDLQDEMRNKKLGDILVTKQIVSPDQLLEAIERQHKMPMVRIGEALLSLGMVSQAQLKDALVQQQIDRNVPLGEVLVRMGVVSRDDLQTALARKMGYPLVNLDAFPAEPEALRALNYTVAARLRVMPLLIRDGRLVVALDDPSRRAAVDEVEFSADMKVVPVLARGTSIDAAVHAAYEKLGAAVNKKMEDLSAPIQYDLTPLPSSTDQLVEKLEKEGLERSSSSDDEKPIEQSDNSLVRLLNNMIIEAHKDGVSDIHIESYPGKEKIRVRFRKDGVLRTYLELPASYRNAMIARVKIMCDLDISERRKPQDGKINFAKFSPQHRIELRVATIPTNNSLEDVVLRILASARPIPIDMLGFAEPIEKALLHVVERPYGLVLCVGPTGSGKTTTLHSALSHINVPERKIWTAEDPVEITQPGLRQVQINAKIGWDFPKALRAFMRADPDVIMLGEIRDEETAHMAIEASLTGHLVLSTLHTNSAPETVTRLLDMGMDPFSFGDALLAVLAQRLVRASCQSCITTRPGRRRRDRHPARRLHERLRPGAAGDARRGAGRMGQAPLGRWPNGDAQERGLRKVRSHRPEEPRRDPRDDGHLARAAPPDPERRPRRAASGRGDEGRHADAAPGRHREGDRRQDDDRGSARDQQRLTASSPSPRLSCRPGRCGWRRPSSRSCS